MMTDEDNQLIEGGRGMAVKLYEDGVQQTHNLIIKWRDDVQIPITVVFAMDYSNSVSDAAFEDMNNSIKAYIDALNPE